MRKTLSISLLLPAVLLLMPAPAAAADVALYAEEGVAGIPLVVGTQGFAAGERMDLVVESPLRTQRTYPIAADSDGKTSTIVPGDDMRIAGTYALRLRKGFQELTRATVNILPDTVDPHASQVRIERRSIDPQGNEEIAVQVMLHDRYGNPLPGRPVALVSSRATDRIIPDARETNADGVQFFTVASLQSGPLVLRAMDLLSSTMLEESIEADIGIWNAMGNHYREEGWVDPRAATMPGGLRASVISAREQPTVETTGEHRRMYYAAQVSTSRIVHAFAVRIDTPTPDTIDAGVEAPNVRVCAVDNAGDIVEGYVGTVLFSSSDPLAVLPNFGEYAFKQRDLGCKDFPIVLSFSSPGEQIFRVDDKSDKTIAGEATITVRGGDGDSRDRRIEITSHKDGQTVNTTAITLEGKAPPFLNLVVTGGDVEVRSDSDRDGMFRIPITLATAKRDVTIQIRDDANRYESAPLKLLLDAEKPTIDSITFFPPQPEAGGEILVVMKGEPDLPRVTMKLGATDGNETVLEENPTTAGTYQGFFTVAEPGSYQPVVRAEDFAGNFDEIRTTLTVDMHSLPRVEGLKATPRESAVELEWQAISEPVDGYRVYVGEDPENFLYTLDTGRPSLRARVSGLHPGRLYYFATTALEGDRESKEKSAVVSARVLGLTLTVTEQDSSLLLQWEFPTDAKAMLGNFLLEYGVAPDTYTEKRLLHGELRATTLRDLINGVTYHIRLTPITTTGDPLEDLAAVGLGTPRGLGDGFIPSASDPIPFDPDRPPFAMVKPEKLSDDGAPVLLIFAGGGSILGFGAYLHRRRRARRMRALLDAVHSRTR